MTLEEAIAAFEEEFPCHSWKLTKDAFDGGYYQGKDIRTIMVMAPWSSSREKPNWRIFCYSNGIPAGFERMREEIRNFPTGSFSR